VDTIAFFDARLSNGSMVIKNELNMTLSVSSAKPKVVLHRENASSSYPQ
jgi:hypothetical protein